MSQSSQGIIVNYRTGIRTQMPKECLLQFAHASSTPEAGKLIGRKVVWKQGKKKFVGKIVGLHGKNGLVRAKFRKGVPGQAIGTSIELIG